MPSKWPWKRRATLVAIAASAFVHAAILVFVLATFSSPSADREPPPIFVSLTSQLPPPDHRLKPKSAKSNAPSPSSAQRQSAGPSAPSPIPAPAVARTAAQDNDLGKALRDSVRCAHPDQFSMDSAERDHCRQSAHARAAGAPTYAALPSNPSTAAALDRERRVSEAWRRYHGSYRSDDHPGLASMFGGGEPCPTGPVCWHPIGH